MLFSTLVNGVNIELTPKSLEKILNIPHQGLTLNEIKMNDDEVFSRIYLPGQSPPMANNKLQPILRLIDRILASNICPKIGSYNYYFRDFTTCVYVIMAKLEVNWARVIFDTLVKEPSTFLPYGAFLTHIFRKFKIDLALETNVVKVFELFDRSVLLRMKLLKTPPHNLIFLFIVLIEHPNLPLLLLLMPFITLFLLKS